MVFFSNIIDYLGGRFKLRKQIGGALPLYDLQ